MKELDEKGFVFLSSGGRPFWCKMRGDVPWLFYWHPDQHWVSLRRLTQYEIWSFPRNLSKEHQQVYHDTHAQNS